MRTFFTLILLLPLIACDTLEQAALKTWMSTNENIQIDDGAVPYQSLHESVQMRAVVEDLDFPWDMVFSGAQEILVTEKPGNLWRIDLATGMKTAISGVPEVRYQGQGGLLGVALHPEFAENSQLYLSYSAPLADGRQTTRLTRARLVDDQLQDVEVLFTAEPAMETTKHYGGALVFDRQGYLYLSVGERGRRHNAQDLGSDLGKVHRFNDDGSIPADNPFVEKEGARPSIFSWGHRNPQGLAMHPETGEVWEAEHGPRGGDEVNRLQAGLNYGWPVITYGEEYRGGKIGEGTYKEGMEQPVQYYVPSIGTAGIAFYDGELIESWRNNLFVGGLVYTQAHLSRLQLDGDQVLEKEALFEHLQMRIRNVESGPDGKLYVLSENGIIFAVD
jgi:aldose sugar dehydrogenase